MSPVPSCRKQKAPSLWGTLAHACPLPNPQYPTHREEPGPLETGRFIDADGGRSPGWGWEWGEGLSQSAMHKAWAHGGKLGHIHLLRILWLPLWGRERASGGESNSKSSKGEVRDSVGS